MRPAPAVWHRIGLLFGPPPRRDPFPEDLRVWYVAARAAALDGDLADAQRLRNAILESDPAFPGMDELENLMSGQ